MLPQIIDLSSDNPDVYDWSLVKAAGIQGMMHRATLGLNDLDPMFIVRMVNAAKQGLICGATQLFYPLDDPKLQAQQFAANVRRFSPLPLAVDLETVLKLGKNEWDEVTNPQSLVESFFAELAVFFTGTPMVYGGKPFLDQYFPGWKFSNPLWVPYYGQDEEPPLPATCSSYGIWQYGQGVVNGIQGEVDQNVLGQGVKLSDLMCTAV